jgi:hypothetical protein
MSQLRATNPLTLPLLIVSVVTVAETVGLILLIVALARRPVPAPSAPQAPAWSATTPPVTVGGGKQESAQTTTPGVTAGSKAPAAASAVDNANQRGFALGKKGQPVDSAGFAITVEKINYQPTYKSLADWGSDYRYLALLIVVENNTGGNVQLFTATFRLQDDQGYPYQQLGLKLTPPTLPFTTLGNRETVRGYLDFVVPKSAKGLKLVYSHLPTGKSQPIHVDLGE